MTVVPVFSEWLEIVGCEEDERCNRGGCPGVLELEKVEGCTCFINPPCSRCVSATICCPVCHWRLDEDE